MCVNKRLIIHIVSIEKEVEVDDDDDDDEKEEMEEREKKSIDKLHIQKRRYR